MAFYKSAQSHNKTLTYLAMKATGALYSACAGPWLGFNRENYRADRNRSSRKSDFRLCESLNFRVWSGYYAASVYETHHDHEYNAIRNAAAMIDVSPLFKYRVSGPDAAKFINRVITRDIHRVAVGQAIYCSWCDEQGKVIDDGTIARLAENHYRWTAAEPNLRWFHQNSLGLDVKIEDISHDLAALAIQGPTSSRLLQSRSPMRTSQI